MDIVNKKTRSSMMAKIRSQDTKPEMIARKYLHSQGFRYRLHASYLPGRPDIVLPKHKVAIFIHGCFWHQHLGCKLAYTPSSNTDMWKKKFADNNARDKRVQSALIDQDWKVIVIWECGLRGRKVHETLLWLSETIMTTTRSWQEYPHLNQTLFQQEETH